MSSPTQRSLKFMRDQGYTAEVVERFNSFTKRRHDLFGFIDILCIKEGRIVGVQTTSAGHISDRRKKILEHANLPAVLSSGIRVIVHGWEKKQNRWQVKEVEIADVV